MAVARWLLELERRLAAADEEALAEALVLLAAVAGADVRLDDAERRAATRRALLLLAAGGDPTRGLDLNGRAVTALAEDVRTVDRQLALETGLRDLKAQSSRLPHVNEAVHGLLAAPEIAWRAWACSVLAEELGEDA